MFDIEDIGGTGVGEDGKEGGGGGTYGKSVGTLTLVGRYVCPLGTLVRD